MTLRLFFTDDFTGSWPVPRHALVAAVDEAQARVLLDAEFARCGHDPGTYTLRELIVDVPRVLSIAIGEY